MAWPTPITWTTGQLVTATNLNEQLRDALNFLMSGTSGQVLTAAGAAVAPTWTTPTSALIGVCNGRVTLTSGTPVTSADVTAATTLYFAPYAGYQIGLYDGSSAWTILTFTEASLAVPSNASTMHDLWVYNNSGTIALEALAWTNDTTRATALTTQNGVLVKTGATTRRYVGSFRTTTVSGQTEDSATKRFVNNYYNQKPRFLLQQETTATWTYQTATWRQQRATATNQVEIVTGVAESPLTLTTRAAVSNDTGPTNVALGIGEDSTTTPVSVAAVSVQGINANMINMAFTLTANLWRIPAVGYHKYCTLESASAVGTSTWLGASTANPASANAAGTAMFGTILG